MQRLMKRAWRLSAVAALAQKPDHALVDGNLAPGLECETTCVIKGDARSLSIAAASIVAAPMPKWA